MTQQVKQFTRYLPAPYRQNWNISIIASKSLGNECLIVIILK